MRYPKSFQRQKPFRSDLTPEEFRSLRSRKIADYFPGVSSEFCHAAGVTEGLALPAEEVARFEADFGSLLSHRKDLQGLSHARRFTVWWDEHKTAYLTRPVIHGYRESGITLGEIVDDLHLHFIAGQNARKEGSRVVRAARCVGNHKAVVTTAFSIAVLFSKSVGFLWSLAVLGPGVQMVNSYTQTAIVPLAQTLQQKGSKDLGPLASNIQDWLTHRGKAEESKKALHDTTRKLEETDFAKLTPEQAKAKWAQFEQTYFNIFLNYNQTLPAHLREGRGFLKDWMVFIQLGVANNLSTFDNQYWMHAHELEALKRRGIGGARDRALARRHREGMEAAESRIAGALAAWKLYEFMYPEYVRDPQNSKEQGAMKGIYSSFTKSMRFDAYVKHFADQMKEVLRQMDADFLMHEGLAQAAQAAGASGSRAGKPPQT